ncbi:MAG TPA: DUF2335 domain-containing protein [Firmicutes bacterium]|nr:DUF2335 domain-containing protein [Bacillota bacterium]
MLAQYKDIIPDAPERILAMAERQHAHCIDTEKKIIEGDIARANLGLSLGFILFILLEIGAIILLAKDKDSGYALLITGLVPGIRNIIHVGRERQQRESDPGKF